MLAKKGESTHVMAYVTPSGSRGGGIHRINSDAKGALALLSALPPAKRLLADRGYDADWFRHDLEDKSIAACIPARRGRKKPARHDATLYKQRHRIENLFARLKDWRWIATRYDRCPDLFLSAICIALTVVYWL
jgi:transposase